MKRTYPYGSYRVPNTKRRRVTNNNYKRRPSGNVRYDNLVVARPTRMAPLATRGWNFPNTGESKVIDIAVGTLQVNTTGTISLLNGCIQGTDYTQRIGRKIQLKSLYVRGRVQLETALNGVQISPQMARMMLVVDTQPNGVVFAITDLLNTAAPESQLNLNNRDRFMIICDKEWVFDPYIIQGTATQSFAVGGRTISPLKKYKKLNMETIFNSGNAGTIADMTSGALYMVWLGSQPAGAATDLNAIVSTRVRFKDP